MHEGNAGFEGGEVRHEREIHHLLNGRRSEHGKAGLAAGHHVRMIAEYVQRMRSQCTRGNMHDHGQQFTRDLVQVGDHQKKSLRSGVGGRQRTGGKRTVHGARGAAFRLHFRNLQLLPPHIGAAGGSPFVGGFRHRRRRGDGIDGGNFRKRIRDVRCGGIAVDGHFFHQKSLRLYNIVFMSGAGKNIPAVYGGKSCPAPALFHIQ